MMRHVAGAAGPIELAIVGVHVAARVSILVRRLRIVHVARERVMRQQRKALGEALLRPDEAGVIARTADRRVDERHVAELRERPPRLRVARAHSSRQAPG